MCCKFVRIVLELFSKEMLDIRVLIVEIYNQMLVKHFLGRYNSQRTDVMIWCFKTPHWTEPIPSFVICVFQITTPVWIADVVYLMTWTYCVVLSRLIQGCFFMTAILWQWHQKGIERFEIWCLRLIGIAKTATIYSNNYSKLNWM